MMHEVQTVPVPEDALVEMQRRTWALQLQLEAPCHFRAGARPGCAEPPRAPRQQPWRRARTVQRAARATATSGRCQTPADILRASAQTATVPAYCNLVPTTSIPVRQRQRRLTTTSHRLARRRFVLCHAWAGCSRRNTLQMSVASAVSPDSPAAASSPPPPPARAGTPRLKQQPASGNALAPGAPSGERGGDRDRRSNRPPTIDPLSDRATQALIRRVLCSQQSGDKGRDVQTPIDELLPPLTSRNDVDLQLYAFLAIILREFVQSWYGKITTDEAFLAEIIHTIAHCTRALEQRLRKLDLESLVFNEIPEVIDKHISSEQAHTTCREERLTLNEAYRVSHQPLVQPPLVVDPREAFHALWPLPFLSPVPHPEDAPGSTSEQLENEAVYRQLLVQAVLAVLLPTEDLENPCLTALVGQIFSELIIGNLIGNKTTQPWLLFECICILARVIEEKKDRTAQRIVSGSHTHSAEGPPKQRYNWSVQGLFLWIIQLVFIFITSIRLLAGAIAMSTSLPPRRVIEDPDRPERNQATIEDQHHEAPAAAKVPILEFSAWRCVGNLVEIHTRMPWLGGILSLMQLGATRGPGRVAGLNSTLDRKAPSILAHHLAWRQCHWTSLELKRASSVRASDRGVPRPSPLPSFLPAHPRRPLGVSVASLPGGVLPGELAVGWPAVTRIASAASAKCLKLRFWSAIDGVGVSAPEPVTAPRRPLRARVDRGGRCASVLFGSAWPSQTHRQAHMSLQFRRLLPRQATHPLRSLALDEDDELPSHGPAILLTASNVCPIVRRSAHGLLAAQGPVLDRPWRCHHTSPSPGLSAIPHLSAASKQSQPQGAARGKKSSLPPRTRTCANARELPSSVAEPLAKRLGFPLFSLPLRRLLSRQIQSLFSPVHLSPALRSLRGVLFPNNAPGTPSLFPPSSDAELRALRRRAASSLLGLVPRGVARVYLCGRLASSSPPTPAGPSSSGPGPGDKQDKDADAMVDEVEGLLMVLGDDYCNKHLLYSVLELILLRLMPELSEKGVVELWDERLG
ncbi:PXA domain protein [Purpureocillium lilacinum]|uniref:PXA domain protein n=1 Tax=Purpureocillium lilacinum TaxID=33203 RepID=A0A2U3EK02_PURLI|nr:PXA domain protein [Purpureocillium lilacinum]